MASPDLLDTFGLTGTVLEGQYRVDGVVGEGGFGVVYRGRHLSLDQPIAIKILKGLDGGDPTVNALVLEKFRAEARLLYTLSQSSLHIVRALDYGAATMPTGAWAPFMILEWLDGRSLAEDISSRRARGLCGRSIDEAMAILEPVADGLAVAHRQQVAHRDIKPANVFLGAQVKVLDFGIAKIMKEGEAAGTKGTFAAFTWGYAAPEQLDPRIGATGLATDVYAFGLLVSELLVDRKPIDGRDVIAIMKMATDRVRRPTPRTCGANVPDALEAVCLRALAVDPRERFPTIGELWSALKSAAHTRDSTAMHTAVAAPLAASSRPLTAQMTGAMPMSMVAPSTVTPSTIGQRITNLPASAPFVMTGPPPGTHPPGYQPTPPRLTPPGPMPYAPFPAASPPPGTAPPGGRFAPPRSDGANPVVIGTIIVFVLALLFTGTCAAIHFAC